MMIFFAGYLPMNHAGKRYDETVDLLCLGAMLMMTRLSVPLHILSNASPIILCCGPINNDGSTVRINDKNEVCESACALRCASASTILDTSARSNAGSRSRLATK